MKVIGTVKWFNERKGYGFIKCDKHEDIFVHYTSIDMDGLKTISEGQSVEFVLSEGPKGCTANAVSVVQS